MTLQESFDEFINDVGEVERVLTGEDTFLIVHVDGSIETKDKNFDSESFINSLQSVLVEIPLYGDKGQSNLKKDSRFMSCRYRLHDRFMDACVNTYTADRIVRALLDDLKGRKGLRHTWEAIDEDTQQEIVKEWMKLTLQNL